MVSTIRRWAQLMIGKEGEAMAPYRDRASTLIQTVLVTTLTPFMINNFVQGRTTSGFALLAIIVVGGVNAYALQQKRPPPFHFLFLFIPFIIGISLAIINQGVLGVLWIYPTLVFCYFVLRRLTALLVGIMLLIFTTVLSALYVDTAVAARVAATMMLIIVANSIVFSELANLHNTLEDQAKRLQSLLDTQQRLLHDVSHELRSPLGRLQAAGDLMRQQPVRNAEFIKHIERDTARMDKLIGELLTLARLDAGMTGRPDEAVDLGEIVTEIADGARLEAEIRNCTITVDLSSPAMMQGNHELLYRAIENVVRNAIRYSPIGGTIEISTQLATGQFRLTVADQGPGVLECDLAAIFDPFFRSGASQPDGYGLGLAITRHVVEAHGGKVFATNRPIAGLLVTLELPCSKT